ncbi:Mariner Mos1 transposase [Anthophora plagiata]
MEQRANIKFCFKLGIILGEFVPQGENVNGEYYLGVMERLWKRIVRVRPEYRMPASWFLLHDNAPSHKTVAVGEFLAQKQVCVLQHPPYSPDLSPCDYFLFPKLKPAMKGTFYDSVTQVQGAVTRVIAAISQNDIKKSMLALVERAQRCIDAEGMYFE